MEDIQTPGAIGPQGTTIVAETPQVPERPAQVEGDGSAPEVSKGEGRESNVQNYIHANKRVTDGIKKDLAELKEMITQRFQQPAPAQAPSAPSPEVDIWTNPQAFIRNEVKQALATDMQVGFAKERLVDQQEKAKEYLLSQDYVDPNSETDKAEMEKIYQEGGFAYAWGIDPARAATGILEIFRARRGIGKPTPSRAQAGAVLSGSSPSSNGSKLWTSKEVAALSAENYEKYRGDIETAYKEGRYRE